MSAAKIASKGQITIPKHIRDQQSPEPGDRVQFLTDYSGHVYLVPANEDVSTLKGMIPRPAKPLCTKAMNATIKRKGAGRSSA
ncbi:MAG: AbrB/MazE/SpoVT family DNA-binding domain-containing protein [Pseudomonadota bacterium]